MGFPSNFLWGAATSAYQIEGAAKVDGRAPSIWDEFSARPGKVYMGHTGEVACDHYHHFKADVALMKQIGLKAYRFSVAWPRVIPQGTGAVNPKGLEFYDRLIDELLGAGIQPWVTLYHWDTPLAMQQRGGWLNRDSVEWFGDYATVMAKKLGDRVSHWMTLNEPQCTVGLGLQDGVFAPGDKLGRSQVLLAWHNILMAHGRGMQALRAGCGRPIQAGFAPTGRERIPLTNSPEDIEAARKAYFEVTPESNIWAIAMAMDPVYLGKYPDEAYTALGKDMPVVTDADLKLISQPVDFLGYNCYTGERVKAKANGGYEMIPQPDGNPVGSLSWLNRMEDSLYWAARFQTERYKGKPFVITENGCCTTDWVSLDGKVHDPSRIDFTARYLRTLRRACEEGYPVLGYFHWSLMDNFEWAEGYRPRFGMIHVDYQTQKRTLKDSALWYSEVIRTNGANIPA